jgi:hypothetical protein
VWQLEPQKIDAVLAPDRMTHAIAFSAGGRFVAAAHGSAREKGRDQAPASPISGRDLAAFKPAPGAGAGA